MPKKILCCRIRAWCMIISWLKIIFHVVYIILLTMNILHLVGTWGGPENMKTQVINDKNSKFPEYYRVLEYAYEYLLFYLLCLLGYNILGLPLNIILLRGAIHKNERKIKIWLYFTLINVVASSPYVLWRLINVEYITNSAIKIAINYTIELLSLWCVFTYFQELKSETASQPQHFAFSPNVMMIPEGEDNPDVERSPPPKKNHPYASYNLR